MNSSVSEMTKVAMILYICILFLLPSFFFSFVCSVLSIAIAMHDGQDYDNMPPKRWLISALWFRCKRKITSDH